MKPTCNTADPKEAGEWQQRQVTFCFIKRFKAKSHLNLFFLLLENNKKFVRLKQRLTKFLGTFSNG